MASLSRIASTPDLTEQVYQRLLYAICDGELAPGARLTQEDLAAMLGVSRQPVLQALRLLKKEVLSATPVGAACGWPARGRTRSPRCTRCGPSSTASPPAVPRRPMPRWTQRCFSKGVRLAAGQRIGSMIDADMLFHHLIYAASGNPLIAETANHHWPHIRRAMGAALQTVGLRRPVWDEHRGDLAGDPTVVIRTRRSGWLVSTARVPATISPPS